MASTTGKGGFLGGVVLSSLFMVFLLAIFFYITTVEEVPQRTKDSVQFLQNAIFVATLFLVLTIPFDISIVKGFVGEYTSIGDVILGVVGGVLGGLILLVLALGGPADVTLQIFTLGQYGFEPHSLSGLGPLGGLKKLAIVDSISAGVFRSVLLNTLIGASEEFSMGVLFSMTLVGLKITQVKNSIGELNNPKIINAILIRAGIFSFGYHIFAYTDRLNYFNPGFFLSAFIIGLFFAILYLWNGVVPCIIAHAIYDFGLDVITSTGWTLLLIDIVVLIVGIVVLYYIGQQIWNKLFK